MLPSSAQWFAQPRMIIGLMSGTSLDGIDAALIEVCGAIPPQHWRLCQFYTHPYSAQERTRIELVINAKAPLAEVMTTNVWLGERFADVALQLITQAGLIPTDIDAIASHGQTIWHIPSQAESAGATMQIGEPCIIAERTGILTVADFRSRDIAAGGQGAPLVPFADFYLFHNPGHAIAVQNIGGIGNVTWLPGHGGLAQLRAFDTGPGNMVIDALVKHFGWGNYDCNGAIAATGQVNEPLLTSLMSHPFFQLLPPKSTGRELFGQHYTRHVLAQAAAMDIKPEDLLATATAFTAESIVHAYRMFLPALPDELILGGGGSHNVTLCAMLQARLPGVHIMRHEDKGICGDAKEAIAFALLAHATLCGIPNNVPAATGAAHPVILGKIIPAKEIDRSTFA